MYTLFDLAISSVISVVLALGKQWQGYISLILLHLSQSSTPSKFHHITISKSAFNNHCRYKSVRSAHTRLHAHPSVVQRPQQTKRFTDLQFLTLCLVLLDTLALAALVEC